MKKSNFVFALVGLFLFEITVAADNWPDWRGPLTNGHGTPGQTEPVGLPLTWSETDNVTWKTEIPYLGLSTPIVMDGKVWLTTATEEGNDFFVICVNAENGEILLNEQLFHSDDPEPLGNGRGANSYATPSAVVEAGRVYVHYGSFGTACLNTESFDVIWKRDDMPCRHYRGASSSPVLFENLVILTFDGADLQYLIALDKRTGETVWKTDRSVEWNDEDVTSRMVREGDWRKAHGTPILVAQDGQTQLVSSGAKAAYGYNPTTGEELWTVEYRDWSAASRPVMHNGRAIFATGFNAAELWAVQINGRGDVTETHVDWKNQLDVPKYTSPVIVDDLIYVAKDENLVACIDANTGERVWVGRIGGSHRASPIYADGRLYFFSWEGVTTVLKPGRAFEILATSELGTETPGKDMQRPIGYMASPAVVGKAFFLRTRDHLYRVEAE